MRIRPLIAAAGALAPLFACSKPTQPQPPAVLNRSGDVQLVCYDRGATDDALLVLPLGCCTGDEPLASNSPDCPVATNDPVLHGLITQTGRGELAAVNLDDDDVVDSDLRIPGYTFVDVGGLPRALVVPKNALGTDGSAGPAWIYVAGAEDSAVQAVATCRFYRGGSCGPEAELAQGELASIARVVLPAEPHDMVLSADGSALWVSMPDAGLLARIALSDDPARPFALGDDDVPMAPTYYVVPAPSVTEAPLDPVAEATVYEVACGARYEPVDIALEAPLAPRLTIDPARRPEPARMLVDPESGVLLLADRGTAVLRAFRESDGAIERVGEWSTGLPLSDFALTAPVPQLAPPVPTLFSQDYIDLINEGPFARYLYAVDSEGLVQVFSFAADEAAPTLAAITPPNANVRYRDRLAVTGRSVAVSVIDSRDREAYLCDSEPDITSDQVAAKKKQRDAAKDRGDQAALDTLNAELEVLELTRAINESAAPEVLRGVFVAVVSSTGSIDFLDVFDQDLACRARSGWCADGEPPYTVDDTDPPSDGQSLVVRRHAQRLTGVGDPDVTVSGDNFLADVIDCPADFYQPTSANVCLPKDPWLASDQSWTVTYEDAIPNFTSSSGMFDLDEDGELWLSVPTGYDLCQHGIEVGDAIHVLTNPIDGAARNCPRPTTGGAFRLEVMEAFVDRVRLAFVDNPDIDAAGLLACYPDLVGFQVHALQSYLVLGEGTFFSRVTSDPDDDGRCVLDTTRDPRLTSRAQLDEPFQNPFVSFTLTPPLETTSPSSVSVTVRVVGQGGPVRRFLTESGATSTGRTDVLPVRARYFRESDELYVVDSASQGLRRFDLTPLLQRPVFR